MRLCIFLFFVPVSLVLFSCADNNSSAYPDKKNIHSDTISGVLPKPPAHFKDTLIITEMAAVFFHPDSQQLLQIKAQTIPGVYDGTMHEFFYQMRNARMVIKKEWPRLKIVEAKNYRYLLFVKTGNVHELVDLDLKKDAFGLFVFNRVKPPLLIDMTNVETEISFYLK